MTVQPLHAHSAQAPTSALPAIPAPRTAPGALRATAIHAPTDRDGAPRVSMSLPLDVAESLMATVARDAQDAMAHGQRIPAHLVSVMLLLQPAIRRGYDQIVDDAFGDVVDPGDLGI